MGWKTPKRVAGGLLWGSTTDGIPHEVLEKGFGGFGPKGGGAGGLLLVRSPPGWLEGKDGAVLVVVVGVGVVVGVLFCSPLGDPPAGPGSQPLTFPAAPRGRGGAAGRSFACWRGQELCRGNERCQPLPGR